MFCPLALNFHCRLVLLKMCVCFQSVTLHTDLGDLKIELFCEQCPKTCEVNSEPISGISDAQHPPT